MLGYHSGVEILDLPSLTSASNIQHLWHELENLHFSSAQKWRSLEHIFVRCRRCRILRSSPSSGKNAGGFSYFLRSPGYSVCWWKFPLPQQWNVQGFFVQSEGECLHSALSADNTDLIFISAGWSAFKSFRIASHGATGLLPARRLDRVVHTKQASLALRQISRSINCLRVVTVAFWWYSVWYLLTEWMATEGTMRLKMLAVRSGSDGGLFYGFSPIKSFWAAVSFKKQDV